MGNIIHHLPAIAPYIGIHIYQITTDENHYHFAINQVFNRSCHYHRSRMKINFASIRIICIMNKPTTTERAP